MNILVVGLGSMGKRRIRLLKKLDSTINILGIDLNEERCKQVADEFKILTRKELSEVLEDEKFDCAFIAGPPISHADLIEKCLSKGMHIFSEINLLPDKYDINIELANRKNKILFLSSTFLYREEIQIIKNKIEKLGEKVNYTYHVGQYLTDWHPWDKLRDYFISHKETNGCRELLAIELPWITDIFGEIIEYKVEKSKLLGLDLDFNDTYNIVFKHESGNMGNLVLDVVMPVSTRDFVAYGEKFALKWDGTPENLQEYDYEGKQWYPMKTKQKIERQQGYALNILENAYYEEVKEFFEVIQGIKMSRYSFERDKKILTIIDAIERS